MTYAPKVIRNTHGQTCYEFVDWILHRTSAKKIEQLPAQCERIAARFLADGNRDLSNFYESAAAHIRAHIEQFIPPPATTFTTTHAKPREVKRAR